MRNLLKFLLSALFATTSVSQIGDMAVNPVRNFIDSSDSSAENVADFSDYANGASLGAQEVLGRCQMAMVEYPDKGLTEAEQVIVTITGRDGFRQMGRALPTRDGYMFKVGHLSPDTYKVEAEIVSRGMFLTDEFILEVA